LLQPFFIGFTASMTRCILNPTRLKGEPRLPATGILAVNPSDSCCLSSYAKEAGLKRSFLFNSSLYSSTDLFLAGAAVGAPMAVMCLEKLIVLGARKIILYGWCGSLQEELHAMDILLPNASVAEEGTSAHYSCSEVASRKSSQALELAIAAMFDVHSVHYKTGAVWTTDAPYRETIDKVQAYSAQGVYGVDMEYSALAAVARFRGVALAGVLLVSDELTTIPWKPHYSFKSFKDRSHAVLRQLCDFAVHDNIFSPHQDMA
jgi:uridine phosphorylase